MHTDDTRLRPLGFLAETDHVSEARRLIASFSQVRERVAQLTSQIAKHLPDLTLHDVTHLDALWDVADTLVGDQFRLNPLEAYVFGCAVLLHDAGLSVEAYESGHDGLRSSLQWKDAHARLSQLPNADHEDAKQAADFEALRALHASQAVRLAQQPLYDTAAASTYLIEDQDLRDSFGHLIGQIAASHSLDITTVTTAFTEPHPPTPFFPKHWIIDPLLIACLLRVADAGHLDAARAPTFLLHLLQRDALSLEHWRAQNRLGRVIPNPHDSSEVVIASTQPFPESHARSWWVAFDAITQLDRELRDCHELLSRQRLDSPRVFAARRVAGAGNPVNLARYVKTEGWKPTHAQVRVTDVARLIRRLGGTELYGEDDKLQVVLRELLQNASDAIAARRAFTGDSFPGRIIVRLLTDGPRYILQVDDDGIGMSERTLTTDLLDFGRSFWRTARASAEFPGIQSAMFEPVGRYGIGFFSAFMIAQHVKVFSRRFDSGIGSVRCLSFPDGLSLRPTLSETNPFGTSMDCSTRLELVIGRDAIGDPDNIRIRANVQGHDGFHISVEEYVRAIVAGVRESVLVDRTGPALVHDGFPPKAEDVQEWLEGLAFVEDERNEAPRCSGWMRGGRVAGSAVVAGGARAGP